MIEQNYIDYKNINDINSSTSTKNNNKDKVKKDLLDIPEKKININKKKLENQHKIIIENIEIYFPYEPYKNQELYMKKIIETLNKKYI